MPAAPSKTKTQAETRAEEAETLPRFFLAHECFAWPGSPQVLESTLPALPIFWQKKTRNNGKRMPAAVIGQPALWVTMPTRMKTGTDTHAVAGTRTAMSG